MTLLYNAGYIIGLAVDAKPTNVPALSLFVETDTRRWYIFDGSVWTIFENASTWTSFNASESVNMAQNGFNETSHIQLGFQSIAADDGEIRLPAAGEILWRNQAADGNVGFFKFNDDLYYSGTGLGVNSEAYISFDLSRSTKITEINANELEFQIRGDIGLRIYNSPLDLQSVIIGTGVQLPTTANDGFLYISNMDGIPTGIPTVQTGKTPIVFNDANSNLYGHDGSEWIQIGGGNVIGPRSSTDNTIARFDGTTGKLIQSSGVVVNDNDAITGVTSIDVNAGGHLYLDGTVHTTYITGSANGIVDIFAGGKLGLSLRETTSGVDAFIAGNPGFILSSDTTVGFIHGPYMGNSATPKGVPANLTTGQIPTVYTANNGGFQIWGFNSVWKQIDTTVGKQNFDINMNDVYVSPSNGATAVIKTPSTGVTFPVMSFPTDVDRTVEFNVLLPTNRDSDVNPDFQLLWYYENDESSDDVVWGVEIAPINQSSTDMTAITYGIRKEVEGNNSQQNILWNAFLVDVDDNGLHSDAIMHVRITRIGTDSADTLDQDAFLTGIRVTYATDRGTAFS